MNDQANHLRRAIEQENDRLKSELISLGYFKTPDGLQLYELTNSELKETLENVKARKGAEELDKNVVNHQRQEQGYR